MNRRVGAAALVCLAVALGVFKLARRESHPPQWDSPLTTPPGITLQPRPASSHDAGTPEAEVLYADAQGHTLYVHQSRGTTLPCEMECARHWPPLLAAPESRSAGDWTLIRRSDHSLQWALRGAPLYRYEQDAQIGDSRGNDADGGSWHAAVFHAGEGLALPVGIAARQLPDAGGVALVDAQGLTLYAFLGNERRPKRQGCDASDCQSHWLPLEAPAIATGTQDLSVLRRADGIAQWAFHGRPLYRFEGDRLPGNANGIGVSTLYQVALVARDFMPPEATVIHHPVLGRILATREGQTLYQRDRVDAAEGGHSFRVDHGPPELGRLFGTLSCEGACIQRWPVFRAPGAAQASGYWQIALRADGIRQWVYRGYALYTYAADRPGEARGNYIYDMGQDAERIGGNVSLPHATTVTTVGTAPIDPAANPGAGIGTLFWHAVVP